MRGGGGEVKRGRLVEGGGRRGEDGGWDEVSIVTTLRRNEKPADILLHHLYTWKDGLQQ